MARSVLPSAGFFLAAILLASPAGAGDYGYGPAPSGRFVSPYDAPFPGGAYPGGVEPGFAPVAPLVRVTGRPVQVYPETHARVLPGPFVVTRTVEPIIGPGLLYNTPPMPDAYVSGALRVRY